MALTDWENEIYSQALDLQRQALEAGVSRGVDPMGVSNLLQQKKIEEQKQNQLNQMRQQLLLEKLQQLQQPVETKKERRKRRLQQLISGALKFIPGPWGKAANILYTSLS